MLLNRASQLAGPAGVGGELRAQVGKVVREVAGRPAAAAQEVVHECFSQAPSRTMRRGGIKAPSSSMPRLPGGIDPGVMPPTSAWCARDAVKNSSVR
jgi:hypothetical protein